MSFSLQPDGSLDLIAFDAARNVARRWSVRLAEDLFGMWTLDTAWGRIGTKGRARRVAHAERTAAQREVAALLRRRTTAQRRIGIGYRLAKGGQ